MKNIDNSSFNDWLQMYSKAWTQRKPELIRELFAKDAKYSKNRFHPLLKGLMLLLCTGKGYLRLKKTFLLNTKSFQ